MTYDGNRRPRYQRKALSNRLRGGWDGSLLTLIGVTIVQKAPLVWDVMFPTLTFILIHIYIYPQTAIRVLYMLVQMAPNGFRMVLELGALYPGKVVDFDDHSMRIRITGFSGCRRVHLYELT